MQVFLGLLPVYAVAQSDAPLSLWDGAAVLLTAALVGAIALARQDDEDIPAHEESLSLEGRDDSRGGTA